MQFTYLLCFAFFNFVCIVFGELLTVIVAITNHTLSDLGLTCHDCSGESDCADLIGNTPQLSGRCSLETGEGKCFIRRDSNSGGASHNNQTEVDSCVSL